MDTIEQPVSASRLAATLAHGSSVRRADVQLRYRILLSVTDDGLSRSDLSTIRDMGWQLSGFSMGRNQVSVVREPHEVGR